MPSPSTNPNASATTDPSQVAKPDAAVDLLSDLEDRLGALKNWQNQSEAQAEKVRERSRSLEDRQRELDEQTAQLEADRADHAKAIAALEDDRADADAKRKTLETELAELDRAQTALDARKQNLADHAVEVEQELDAKHRKLEAEETKRLDAVADLESAAKQTQSQAQASFDEAKARQAELDATAANLEEAQAKLDEAKELLAERIAQADDREAALDQRETQLQDVANKLEAERAKLDERAADLEAKARELDRISDDLDAEMTRLTARQAELDAATQTLDEQRATLDADQQTFRETKLDQDLRTEELEAREASLAKSRQKLLDEAAAGKLDETAQQERQADLAKQTEELDELRAAHDAAVAELETAREQATTHQETLAAAQHELEGAKTLIAQRESELTGLRDQLDARVDELAELREQLDAAQRETETTNDAALPPAFGPIAADLDDNEPEVADEDDNLPTFTFGSTEAQAESDAEPNPATPGLDKLQALVEEREIEIADLRSLLDAQATDLEDARTIAEELQTQLDAALAANETAETAAAESAAPVDGELVQRVAALTETLDERTEQLEDAKHDLDARTAEVQVLRDRVEALTKELQEGHEFDDEAAAGINQEEFDRRRNELDEQAAQIAADRQRVLDRKAQLKQADEIIKQRREKIRHYIKAAKEQVGNATPAAASSAAPIAASDAARVAGLDRERAALAEVKNFLEQSEAAMVRRWATNKTGSLVTSTVIAVILAVGFSFFVGSQMATPVYRASMSVEVQPNGDAAELPPGAWLTDYKRTLLSPPVLAEALNQMDQQGVRIAGTPEQLEAHLRDHLVATGNPSRVELAYHGGDTAEVGAVLEAYGRGLLVHHMSEDRKAGRLTDTARVLQPAVAESKPIQDDRLKFALATFAAIFAGAALLALPLRLLYGRSQRVLHEEFMPELAMLNDADPDNDTDPEAVTAQEEEDFIDDVTGSGVRNDGPPAGFARIPNNVADDEPQIDDEDDPQNDEPEQVFRF